MKESGPYFHLSGVREDIDAGFRNRDGVWGMDLEETRLTCEVLATGQPRNLLRREQGGCVWNLEWTLEDPRPEEEQVKTTLAEQLLWFFPGGEDWTVFRMSCTKLIHGFGRELQWLLKLPEQPFRTELNALVVLLDQATLRVGL